MPKPNAMMTSGLVVLLDSNEAKAEPALKAIREASPMTVGERSDRWLSVALETADTAESERWHDWLCRLPGVEGVEVVFVHWDEPEEAHA